MNLGAVGGLRAQQKCLIVMQWRNDAEAYGLISIFLHWLFFLAVVGLFGLGLYMTGLDYYHPLYNRLPAIHKSVGLLLAALYLLRLGWRWANPQPVLLGGHWEVRLARAVHWLMYLLLLVMFVSGYFIASAEGEPIPVFDWFSVPALVLPLEDQADVAGEIHEIAAWALILLAAGHAGAALKHHFIDRDRTLVRMLRSG